MSLLQLRKDAFRKLAKLCSKTSIMENPALLPDEARGFVDDPNWDAFQCCGCSKPVVGTAWCTEGGRSGGNNGGGSSNKL